MSTYIHDYYHHHNHSQNALSNFDGLDPTDDHTTDTTTAHPLDSYLADAESSFDTIAAISPAASGPHATHHASHVSSRHTEGTHTPSPSGHHRLGPLSPFEDDDHADTQAQAGSLGTPALIKSRRMSDDAWVERFRFLVASSGLLEKTQILGTPSPTRAPTASSGDADESVLATSPPSVAVSERSRRTIDSMRWDVVTAVVLVVVSMACVFGTGKAVVPSAALATAAGLFIPTKLSPILMSRPSSPSSPTSSQAFSPKEASHDVDDEEEEGLNAEPELEPEAEAPETPTDDSTRVMDSLQCLLAESHSLDDAIGGALRLLTPRPDDIDYAHQLRIAVNRLADDLTDSLAAAASALTPLADKDELKALGGMYDIPSIAGQRRRLSISSESEDEWANPTFASHRAASGVDSIPGENMSFDPNDKFTKLPDRLRRHRRPSRSTDWGSPVATSSPLNPLIYRPPLDVQIAQADRDMDYGAENLSNSSADDSIPSTLPEQCNPRDGSLSPPLGTLSPPRLALSKALPFTPKRASPLAQAVDHLEQPSYPPSSFSAPAQVPRTSASAANRQAYRRSLQDIPYITSQPPSTLDAAASLAQARAAASMSAAKRRSLQTPMGMQVGFGNLETRGSQAMNEDAILATAASLTRARSLPHSSNSPMTCTPIRSEHRSSLLLDQGPAASRPAPSTPQTKRRSVLSNGSGSVSSIYSPLTSPDGPGPFLSDRGFGRLGLGPSPHLAMQPDHRVMSISPLTLQGLRASCLGVHHKRRRVAACLLGLRFDRPRDEKISPGAGEYWTEVRHAIEVLSSAMVVARERLAVSTVDAEREASATLSILDAAYGRPGSCAVTPPPPGLLQSGAALNRTPGLPADFAPRDSAEQTLLASIDELQRTLARVWARCDEARSTIVSDGINSTFGGASVISSEVDTSGASSADLLGVVLSDVRGDIGSMLRQVERGRDALASAAATAASMSEAGDGDDVGHGDLGDDVEVLRDSPQAALRGESDDLNVPEYIKHWTRPVTPEPIPDEELPPQGVDEVYEATIPSGPSRSGLALTREARIVLMKEARGRGMTLTDLLAERSRDANEVEAERALAQQKHAQQAVLGELRVAFGDIRLRKGIVSAGPGQNGVEASSGGDKESELHRPPSTQESPSVQAELYPSKSDMESPESPAGVQAETLRSLEAALARRTMAWQASE